MTKKFWTTCLGIMMIGFCCAKPAVAIETTQELPIVKPPLIQIAILLDTSSSMSGLIDQAKTQLWSIVNEFVTTRRDGRIPELQVGLYEYGKSSIPAKEGYIRMILPLTTNLDKVSEELFVLKTNGGDEYCGQVIQSAAQGLSNRSPGAAIAMISRLSLLLGTSLLPRVKLIITRRARLRLKKG